MSVRSNWALSAREPQSPSARGHLSARGPASARGPGSSRGLGSARSARRARLSNGARSAGISIWVTKAGRCLDEASFPNSDLCVDCVQNASVPANEGNGSFNISSVVVVNATTEHQLSNSTFLDVESVGAATEVQRRVPPALRRLDAELSYGAIFMHEARTELAESAAVIQGCESFLCSAKTRESMASGNAGSTGYLFVLLAEFTSSFKRASEELIRNETRWAQYLGASPSPLHRNAARRKTL